MKDKFIGIYKQHIKRAGAEELLQWLLGTDFFEAPASTRFHLARPGGLVEHSINVYNRLRRLYIFEYGEPLSAEQEEKIAICGLLHDLCKVNFYKKEMRNRKNEDGQWEKYPFYVVNDTLPYGHGEKSVYIILGFMKLSREEAMAIRWHMGGFDDSVKGGSFTLSKAFDLFPFALLTHIADLEATHLEEADK